MCFWSYPKVELVEYNYYYYYYYYYIHHNDRYSIIIIIIFINLYLQTWLVCITLFQPMNDHECFWVVYFRVNAIEKTLYFACSFIPLLHLSTGIFISNEWPINLCEVSRLAFSVTLNFNRTYGRHFHSLELGYPACEMIPLCTFSQSSGAEFCQHILI